MGKNYKRQLGTRNIEQGSKIRIRGISQANGDKTNICTCSEFRNLLRRGSKFITKRGYNTCTFCRKTSRFLQYAVSSKKENRRSKTSDKLETTQQLPGKTPFQNGHSSKNSELSSRERLGSFSRSKGCLFSYPSTSITPKVPTVLHPRAMFSISSNVLRTHTSPSSVYKGCISSSSTPSYAQHTSSSLPRRLACRKQDKTSTYPRSRESVESSHSSGLHYQCQEISVSTMPRNSLPGQSVQTKSRPSLPHKRSHSVISRSNAHTDSMSDGLCNAVPSCSRHHGIMYRIDTICSSENETNTNTSVTFLETGIERSRFSGSHYSTHKGTFALVVSASKHSKGQVFAPVVFNENPHNRCFQDGLWSSSPGSVLSGNLVEKGVQSTYQCTGTRGSSQSIGSLSACVKKSESLGSFRQCHGSSVSEQARGYTITEPLFQSLESVPFCHSEPDRIESSTYSREVEHFGRSFVEEANSPIRMVNKQSSNQSDFCTVEQTADRSVCISAESQNTRVLHMVSKSGGSSSRRTVNSMGGNVRLCISSHRTNSEGSGTHVTVQLPDDSDSSLMATSSLVHKVASTSDRYSKKSSAKRRSSKSAKHKDISPKSRNSETIGMAALNSNFKSAGFSKKVRKLLAASWRKGTKKDYCCKFRKFNSWCVERHKDPYSASLTDCAEFLTFLFEEGLQYRTIGGYRSMLSSVLPPIDKVPIGQHPYIIRLLKGVFNSRPPKVKLLPDWDLQKVLNMLQKSPFEPLKYTSLKHLTYKTIFLVAITTFRRCSDLQALRLGEESVTVTSRGLFFVRQGLSKQDRPNHFGSKIFVPAFEEKKLDPKRTMAEYLKRTDKFRKGSDGNEVLQLFLGISKPHKPVSRQTISNWIVKTIQMAYDEEKNVKAHSTRSIGPSWALFKGASMSSILETADWARETTFTKFYLKNVESSVVLR